MIILGIDPGFDRLGWGLIETLDRETNYVDCGCITSSRKLSHQDRLGQIAEQFRLLLKRAKPEQANIETLYFSKNQKTALRVAEARGVILVALREAGIRTAEFTPTEVKLGITGHGAASKDQVAWMVKNILKIKDNITSDDALDALALCLMLKR